MIRESHRGIMEPMDIEKMLTELREEFVFLQQYGWY
jgi:hypothetical protein